MTKDELKQCAVGMWAALPRYKTKAEYVADYLSIAEEYAQSQKCEQANVSGSLPPVTHPDTYVYFLLWLYNEGLITDYDFDFEKVSKRYVRRLSRRQISAN